MKMSISNFDEKIKQHKSKLAALDAEIADLANKEAELSKECNRAIESGDVDAYAKACKEKEQTAQALFVKRSFREGMKSPVTESDAREAWESYATEHDKKIRKLMADFEAEKKKMLQMYSELVSIQNEALKVREHLCEVTGLNNPESFEMAYIPFINGSDPGTIKLGNLQCFDTDLVYFAACLEASSGMRIALNPNSPEALKSQHFYNVVVRHKSC